MVDGGVRAWLDYLKYLGDVAFEWWIAVADQLDIRAALEEALSIAGFNIDEGGTTSQQLSALKDPSLVGGYWSNVRLVAMWEDRSHKRIRIELRSDEPMLRPKTHCEESARKLQELLPPA